MQLDKGQMIRDGEQKHNEDMDTGTLYQRSLMLQWMATFSVFSQDMSARLACRHQTV